MEAFIYGLASILSFDVALFVILSFILFGKLSSFFGSHLAKVILLSMTTLFIFYSFVFLSPASAFELFSSISIVVLVLTIAICLNLLGIFRSIKSAQLRFIVEGVFNWLAPVVFGYWLFAQSFTIMGPFISSQMMSQMNFDTNQSVELMPLFFGLGLVFVVGGVLTLSWFFHDKFKDMQFWKVVQVLASVAVLIFSLRLLIQVAVY